MKAVLTHIAAGVIGFLVCLAAALLVEIRCRQEPGVRFVIDENRLYLVERVVDGDTFVIDNGLHVRLLGIDAPEVGRYVHEPTPFSEQSAARLKKLIEGRKVRLLFGDRRVGPHGRIIADAFLPPEELKDGDPEPTDMRGLRVSGVLVRNGLAETAEFFGGRGMLGMAKLEILQQQAKAKKAGIWSISEDSPLITRAPDGRPFRYVAASDSGVFHTAGGGVSKRISPKHKLGWLTLLDALASGRRPSDNLRKKIETVFDKIDAGISGEN